MKAWYIIGILMALVPLCFRNRSLLGSTEAKNPAGVAVRELHTGRRIILSLLLLAIGLLVYAWAATPPLPR